MKKIHLLTLLVLFAVVSIEAKRLSKSRSSSRGSSSSKTKYNPSPTSLSYPQPSAPKQQSSMSGWQEKSAQRSQTSHSKPSNSQSHSYPSSQTGLSGSSAVKTPNHQESIQRSNAPSNTAAQSNAQPSGHSYPASSGLSGNSGTGAGYPQGSGLSGSGAAYPQGSGLSGSGSAPHSAGNYPSNNFGNHQGPPPSYSNANSYPKQQGSGLSGSGAAPPPYNAGNYPSNNFGNNYHHQQGPPPPYGGHGGYHGGGGYGGSPQMPGYFGNYGGYGNKGFGGVSRSRSALTGVGIAGAGVGTLLTGLALWNLARSTGSHRHTVIYDNRGQPVAVAPNNSTEPAVDPILGELVNCTLTISNDNATEVLAIPCAIATSFTPDSDVKDSGVTNNPNDNTKCTVTVLTKTGKEFMTTIPCSILLNTAAENNVTEPPLLNDATENGTEISPGGDRMNSTQLSALRLCDGVNASNASINCTLETGEIRDPINPCFAVTHNITVIPLQTTENSSLTLTTPGSA